jgi:hypothetical protein
MKAKPSAREPSTSTAFSNLEEEVIQLTAKKRTPRKGDPHRARDLENSSLALKPGQQIREFLEILGQRQIDPTISLLDLMDMLRQWTPKEEHMRLLCGTGLATITASALRGNIRAAQYLVDRFMGEADRPFVERVQEMNLGTAQAEFIKECRAAGIEPSIAEQLLAGAVSSK